MRNPNESSDEFVNRVMAELDEALKYLPKESLRDVQAHRELFIPRLIRCLEDACDEFEEEDIAAGNAHFFALFLLTEFQAMSAWPAIRRAISLPDEGVEELFGDASTGFLCRVLAVFAAEHPEWLDELLSNRSIDVYVRWEPKHREYGDENFSVETEPKFSRVRQSQNSDSRNTTEDRSEKNDQQVES